MSEVRRLYSPGPYRHWFDRDTMRFFNTVLPSHAVKTWHGNYFVTKETSPSGVSAYTVRRQDPDNGDISTLGEFHAHRTYEEARRALHAHLEAKEVEHA
jgi:hypothetical protein